MQTQRDLLLAELRRLKHDKQFPRLTESAIQSAREAVASAEQQLLRAMELLEARIKHRDTLDAQIAEIDSQLEQLAARELRERTASKRERILELRRQLAELESTK